MNFVEKIIVRKIAEALLTSVEDVEDKEGSTITVSGERGYDYNTGFNVNFDGKTKDQLVEEIVAEADQYDEVLLFVGGNKTEGFGPWVYLIFGNGNGGWDVVTDYMTSLEPVMEPIMDFIHTEGD